MRISDWSSDVCSSDLIVALSVSISARISPDLTVSPSLTSHFASVPSSIVGDSAGIFNSMAISILLHQHVGIKFVKFGFGRAFREAGGLGHDRAAIGNAWCRERVCRDV